MNTDENNNDNEKTGLEKYGYRSLLRERERASNQESKGLRERRLERQAEKKKEINTPIEEYPINNEDPDYFNNGVFQRIQPRPEDGELFISIDSNNNLKRYYQALHYTKRYKRYVTRSDGSFVLDANGRPLHTIARKFALGIAPSNR